MNISNVRRAKRKEAKSQFPNFNEMVSLKSMVNPLRKPIRHLSSKINRLNRKSKNKIRDIRITFPDEKKKKAKISIINIKDKEVVNENENFRTFAPDDELNDSKVLDEPQEPKEETKINMKTVNLM